MFDGGTEHMYEDFFCEEVRYDFLVTKEMKKVWAAELNILKQFDTLCRENGLKYFAAYGTLLGAVRHNGFIPWDDDLDVFMFRDDYAKFEMLAVDYFQEPYVFQGIDNGYVLSAHTKIRDSRTTAIEYKDAPKTYNQGIFIDVFPLDDTYNGDTTESIFFEVQKLLWKIAIHPNEILKLTKLGQEFVLDADLIQELCLAGPVETLRQLEMFNEEHFGYSETVNFITNEIYGLVKCLKREWFSETIYMPFENTVIPVPGGYDKILSGQYGDYMTPVRKKSAHSLLMLNPDKPYTDYLN